MVSRLILLYTILLGVSGVVLLFAPHQILLVSDFMVSTEALVLAQVVGAGLIGFAIANWTGRGLTVGGLYGRPLVAGNQAFAFVGALVLLRDLLGERTLGNGSVLLFGILAFGAALYSALMFGGVRASAPLETP